MAKRYRGSSRIFEYIKNRIIRRRSLCIYSKGKNTSTSKRFNTNRLCIQHTCGNRTSYGWSKNKQQNDANNNTINVGEVELHYKDAAGTIPSPTIQATIYDTYEDWLAASGGSEYKIPDGEAVIIRHSGEMIFNNDTAATVKNGEAQLEISYTKTGFSNGEVRPEYYYDCKDVTDPNNVLEYKHFDDEGNVIYQDINYVVAANQTLTVNTLAASVFDSAIGRDVDEMIDAVQYAMDANQKVEDIEKMMKMDEYSSDECQAKLESWLAAAKKEADYADDNLQKLYNSYIGNFDGYLEGVVLAQTDVGSKGQSLDLTKNRMANQQTTMEELKSTNEDRELSDIIIDYTSAYTAYQASLQAASKVNQVTLLSYLQDNRETGGRQDEGKYKIIRGD